MSLVDRPGIPESAWGNAEPGIGLCLSGGGFRAMLFHVGALWRLNDAGLLPKIVRLSSVSGGSITNGMLARAWSRLDFDADGVSRTKFVELVAEPLREYASRRVDIRAGLSGLLVPGRIGRRVAASYRHHLFEDITLGQLPAPGLGPRFTFCATDFGSGHLWYHERDRVGEYESGFVIQHDYPLALAVASSSAFPPFLSPIMVDLSDTGTVPPGHPTRYRLCDGGVYDNLGLQPVEGKYQIVLASDAGSPFVHTDKAPRDWFRQLIHTTKVIDTEVRRLRRGTFVGGLATGEGAYFGIGTDIAAYAKDENGGLPFDDPMDAPFSKTAKLAAISTRLSRVPSETKDQLVNWGYAVTDAALRKYVCVLEKGTFPYKGGVG